MVVGRPYDDLILHRVSRQKQYLFSVLAVCLAAASCFLFSAYIGSEVVAFILLLVLSVIAMFFDIFPVILAAVLSALIWDYFFLLPRFNFRVGNTEDKIMLSMYFIIVLVHAVLTAKLRQIGKIARQKEEKAQTFKLYDTLLNSLSHEFRTPIATIIGATDNLLENPGILSPDDKDSLLMEISIASLRLNQQVENLLNMSRVESGFIRLKKDWCDMNELVNITLQRLSGQANDHILEIGVEEGLPLFQLDFGLMEQVLYNLVSNAVLYTPPGTRIRVIVEYQVKRERLILRVEDNGNGLPEEEFGKVFEKFYRLNTTRVGGTGLGLSIVKGFVEAHEGTVDLRKGSPAGAVFTISLPAAAYHAYARELFT